MPSDKGELRQTQLANGSMFWLWEDGCRPYCHHIAQTLCKCSFISFLFLLIWILFCLLPDEITSSFHAVISHWWALSWLAEVRLRVVFLCQCPWAEQGAHWKWPFDESQTVLWRQPFISVAVVTPIRTAKRQSDRVSVVTADFCYFCLLNSCSGWKSN